MQVSRRTVIKLHRREGRLRALHRVARDRSSLEGGFGFQKGGNVYMEGWERANTGVCYIQTEGV
jgi:hypothetical protein